MKIEFSEGAAVTVSPETAIRSGVRRGDDVTPEHLRRLVEGDTVLRAKNDALRLLALRPRTEHEIGTRLRGKEYSQAEIDSVVSDLRAAGILDDERFARSLVSTTLLLKPVGRQYLQRRMKLLGLSGKTITDALAEVFTDDTEGEAALAVAEKFMQRMGRRKKQEEAQRIRHRLVDFLSRRGFNYGVIQKTIRTMNFSAHEE